MTVLSTDRCYPTTGQARPDGRLSASDRIALCGKQKRIVSCQHCGKFYSVTERCRHRLCPHCARVRSMRWFHRLVPVVKRFRWPAMLTLTIRPGPDLEASLDLALSSFRRLRRSLRIKRGFYAVEVLPNDAGWYVHIHCLIDCGWLDMARVQAVWAGLTGSYVCKVKRVDRHRANGALLEVIKYVSKGFGGEHLDLWQVDTIGESIHGRRLVALWGCGSGSLLDTEETIQPALTCVSCGSGLVYLASVPVEAFPDIPAYEWPRAGPVAAPGGQSGKPVEVS